MNGFRVQSQLRPFRCHEALQIARDSRDTSSAFEIELESETRFTLRHAGPYQGNIFKAGLYLNGTLQEVGRGTIIKGWFSSSITMGQILWAVRVLAVVTFAVIAYRIKVPMSEENVIHYIHLLWPLLTVVGTVPAQKRLQRIEKRWKRQLVEQVKLICFAKKVERSAKP